MKKIYSLVAICAGLLWGQAQFVEGFEGTALPSGWTSINQGDVNGWGIFDNFLNVSVPRTGGGMLGIQYGSTAHDDYIITPPITVTAGVSDKLVFYGWNHGLSFLEEFDLKISTTTATPSAFTTNLATAVKPPSRVWTQYNYDLSAYVGQTIYIAFYISTTDRYFLGIDDFQITGNLLSTAELSNSKRDSVFPNPFVDVINLDAHSGEIMSAKVYDRMGRLVAEPKLVKGAKKQSLDLSKLLPGVYTLSYIDNGTPKSEKIIKK